jgi:hypothetical protein
MLLLNIIPMNIEISRSYKLGILWFLKSVLSSNNKGVFYEVLKEVKLNLLSKTESLAFRRKMQSGIILLKNKHKSHFRW